MAPLLRATTVSRLSSSSSSSIITIIIINNNSSSYSHNHSLATAVSAVIPRADSTKVAPKGEGPAHPMRCTTEEEEEGAREKSTITTTSNSTTTFLTTKYNTRCRIPLFCNNSMGPGERRR